MQRIRIQSLFSDDSPRRHLRYGTFEFPSIDGNAPVRLILGMIEGRVRPTCLKEVEDLARMTEQQRRTLEFLWLKLEDLDTAIQSSRNAKEVRRRDRVVANDGLEL